MNAEHDCNIAALFDSPGQVKTLYYLDKKTLEVMEGHFMLEAHAGFFGEKDLYTVECTPEGQALVPVHMLPELTIAHHDKRIVLERALKEVEETIADYLATLRCELQPARDRLATLLARL